MTDLGILFLHQQVWWLETKFEETSFHAHEESVLGLYLPEDGDLLFSSGGDAVVNVCPWLSVDPIAMN